MEERAVSHRETPDCVVVKEALLLFDEEEKYLPW